MTLTLLDVQFKGKCNWCRNPLDTVDGITEANFIDTGKKFSDGTAATAVYCNECLPSTERKGSPKSVLNLENGDEINLYELPSTPEVQPEAEQQQEQQ